MTMIKTFSDYDVSRIDKEINNFLSDNELIDIKTNVCVEPANNFIDKRGYSTVVTYNYIVIYKEKAVEKEPYEEDNLFMQEYFQTMADQSSNPHL